MPPPLTGIRVLDLSTIVAGPTASMVLGDLGADVIKVERIDGGDDGRSMGPHRGPWGAFFVPLNRGKRSIAVDVTKPAGRDIILRLASTCDVFVENFRGGKAAALGLDESAVRARKPDIIYASLTAYGARGPDYTKPGYDALAQGRSGIVSVTGTSADAPIRAGVSIIDMGAGVWIALGVLAALFERQRSGRGQRVDSSLFQTGVMLMSYHLMYRQFTGVDPKPQGSRHTAFAPYGAFPTATGAIMIGISNDRQFRRLCDVIGKPELADDPRFETNPARVAHVDALEVLISDVFRTQPASHWVAALDAADVPNDAVQKAGQVLADPQLAALGQLAQVTLPGEQSAVVPGLPIELSLTPSRVAGPPPALSQHSRAILHEAGYSDAEIEELARGGACKIDP
ncbi:MAG TPA: CoA transferase [Bryobacteraceae bacterium]|nr:CoA transferase [Bryobacteraceae bacterium]